MNETLEEIYLNKGLKAFHMDNDLEEMFKQFNELDEELKKYFIEALGYSVKEENIDLPQNEKLEMMLKMMDEKIDNLNKEKSSTMMKNLNEQELINVEEFEILFKRGKESQKKYRARLKNPLPTFSSGGSGVDTIYNRLEAQKWMKRYL